MSMRHQCILYATTIDLGFPPTLKLLVSLLEPRSEIRKVKENESSLYSSPSLVSPSLLLHPFSHNSPPPTLLPHPSSPTPPSPHPSSSSPHFFPFSPLPFPSPIFPPLPSLNPSLLYQKQRAHFGGFSTVRYILKSVISFCMPGRELGKLRSLSRATVCSIHSRRLDAIASYSSFMFSMSTMMPMIWGRGGGEGWSGEGKGSEGSR